MILLVSGGWGEGGFWNVGVQGPIGAPMTKKVNNYSYFSLDLQTIFII